MSLLLHAQLRRELLDANPVFLECPLTQILCPADRERFRRAPDAELGGRQGTQRADPTLRDLSPYQSEPPPSLSPGPGQGSKEYPSAGTQRSCGGPGSKTSSRE